MPRKVSITIYPLNEQSELLVALSAHTRVPMSVYIREGVDLIIKANRHLLEEPCQSSSPPKE